MPAEYVPTADQRALVENAAAFGLTQADSAEQLKIDEKTLRKHFQDELSSGKFKVDMTAGWYGCWPVAEGEMPAEYEPTAEQRALVESASAIGITQAEIANQLKIDEKTP